MSETELSVTVLNFHFFLCFKSASFELMAGGIISDEDLISTTFGLAFVLYRRRSVTN